MKMRFIYRKEFGISSAQTGSQSYRTSDRPQPSPIQTNGSTMSGTVVNTPISARAPTPGEIAAKKRNSMVDTDVDEQIGALLQAACQRVLTLSEQRVSHALDLRHLRWTLLLVVYFSYEF